jgi:16S rRNA (cytidine1402-2'-O)-methyltransferase
MSKLFIIPRDIGNFDDISLRAVNIIKECDFILCEDTRVEGIFLKRHNIEKKELFALNEFNERNKAHFAIERILKGENACLMTDAGTPSVSDPGYFLISQSVIAGIEIKSIPGPSSVITALVGSGFPTDAFTFYGFLPKKTKKRTEKFQEALSRVETGIFFESPYRIDKALEDLVSLAPEREIVVARELTKAHEEFVRGSAKSVLEAKWVRKGEMVLIIKGDKNAQ